MCEKLIMWKPSLVPRPLRGRRGKAWCSQHVHAPTFPVSFPSNVRKTWQPQALKIYTRKAMHYSSVIPYYGKYMHVLTFKLELSKEGGQLDRHSLLKTGLNLTVIIHALPAPQTPGMDLIGPLKETPCGNKYIVTLTIFPSGLRLLHFKINV